MSNRKSAGQSIIWARALTVLRTLQQPALVVLLVFMVGLFSLTAFSGSVAAATYTLKNNSTTENRDECLQSWAGDANLDQKCPADAQAEPKNATEACNQSAGSGVLQWLMCPVVAAIETTTGAIDNLINEMLAIKTDKIWNDSNPSGAAYHQAWNSFRYLALGLIVVAALVVVIAEAADIEVLSAYNLRKTLPRLLFAAVFITLSWDILQFLIQLSNDAGIGIRALIYGPFKGLPGGISTANAGIAVILSSGAVVAAYVAIGVMGMASYLLTALVAGLVAYIVLIVRELVIMFLIIFAPVAIACYILPNTQKVWNIWKTALISLLIVFPIITGIIATGRALSSVAMINNQGLVAMVAYIVPYFMVPMAFRMAGGVMATLTGMINDPNRGIFDRLSNFRKGEQGYRHEQRMAGKMGMFGNRGGSLYRRAFTREGLDFSSRGQAKYRAVEELRQQAAVQESLKRDNLLAGGDDNATEIGQRAKTRQEFITMYAKRNMESNPNLTEAQAIRQAQTALGNMEASYGNFGTRTFRQAAFTAAATSVTGYKGDGTEKGLNEGIGRLREDAARMVADGFMSNTSAAAVIKSNKARGDQSAVSFGTWVRHIQNAADQVGQGKAPSFTQTDLQELRQSALLSIHPGQFIGARSETIDALAPFMAKNIEAAASALTQAKTSGNKQAIAEAQTKLDQRLAHAASSYDLLAQTNNENAGKFGDMVMGAKLSAAAATGLVNAKGEPIYTAGKEGPTVQQLIDEVRNNPVFMQYRREWNSSALAQQQQYQRQQTIGGQPPNVPTQPPGVV